MLLDHYIANVVSSNCAAIKSLFHRILLTCDESGLIGKKHFAIDACKLPTDASKEWSGKHSELEKNQIIIDTKAFGIRQEQVTLKSIIESIKKQYDEDIFASGPHMRFRGYLKDCRDCPIQKQCMKKEVKIQGRQISVLIQSKRKVTPLDKMRKVIDSEDGKQMYSCRMHTIEPVFGNICSNKGLNK